MRLQVHVHAHRGSISFMKQLLAEWSQLCQGCRLRGFLNSGLNICVPRLKPRYIGMPGILTMEDEHAKELRSAVLPA